MLSRLANYACLLLLTGLQFSLYAQTLRSPADERNDREQGSFFLRNYSSKEYNSASDNWGVLQDSYGNMVFANGNGVLIYDGKLWSLIETPTQSVIRSMAMDDSGKVYIGGLDDLGYLDKGSNGKAIYVSLLGKIQHEHQAMGNVWTINILKDEIYFESEIGLFLWNNRDFKFIPWSTAGAWHKSFIWNNKLHVSEEGTGLLRFDDDKFELVSDGGLFRNKRIYSSTRIGENKILLGTKFDGIFLYDGFKAVPFQTPATGYVKRNEIYSGLALSDTTVAIGTKFGGVVILDDKGRILSMISRPGGLPTDNVRAMGVDKNGDLWLALYEGITHVEISNGLSIYDEGTGLESAANDICRYQGNLYVNNPSGSYILKPAALPDSRAHFERLNLPPSAVGYGFLPMHDRLLISSSDGVFQLQRDKITQVTTAPAYALLRLKGDSSRILIASDANLQSYRLVKGKWVEAKGVDSVKFDNVKFNETLSGRIWITTFSQGATLVSFVQPDGTVDYDKPDVKTFGPLQGLPEGFIKISSVGGYESFRIGSKSQLLKFDYSSMRFVPDSLFGKTFGFASNHYFPVSNALPDGEFLMKSKRNEEGTRTVFVVTPSPGGYKHSGFDTSRPTESIGVMTYWDKDYGVIWHVGTELIVRQKMTLVQRDTSDFHAYINRIFIDDDSLIYQGIGEVPADLKIKHDLSALRFEYTSNNLVAESENLFQHKLEGYDDDWSDWSKETVKEYSRLWEGQYTFSVRSKDFQGIVSKPQQIAFTISPPGYRTVVAFVAYLILLAVAVWLLLRWRSYKLELEKVALQKEIDHQTQEIREQNVLLAEQSEELRVNAEQLKDLDTLKSNFFVNISHEFRTPLSLILGPLEKVIEEHEKGVRLPDLQRMFRSAKRLQQLINQLLDLAKLEAGEMKVVEQQHDILYYLRVLTASFESLADIRNIEYHVLIPLGAFETMIDYSKFETIIYNLLSNAFKFTPEGGSISVNTILEGDVQKMLTIRISDTGPGIPEQSIQKIFDRFYQVDATSSRAYEGSGIGLSLVKELITLLHGTIQVESIEGHGTSFTVKLPLKGSLIVREALKENGSVMPGAIQQLDEPAPAARTEDAVESEELILLVEDNTDLRDYLRENLEGDYKIEVAENGEVGLQKAIELVPDLILSDMMMPRMDGFTLCTKIREDERVSHIPFVLLTARSTIESKLEGLELGADEYMTKPFNIREVQVRVKNLLEQRKILRRSFSKEVILHPKNISVTSADERFLNHALEVMETHLGDQQFSVERFAEEMGMSRKNLLRKIKAMTDESVNEFIRNFRLKRAAQLIQGKAGTVGEIAYQVGFNNLSYFSKCFKELLGVLPTEMAAKPLSSTV